ncbi:ethylene-responsive transcription factor 4-like [Capsicum galapagoense]
MPHHVWPPQLHQSSQTLLTLTVVLFASPTTAFPPILSLILGGESEQKVEEKVKGFVEEVHYRVRKRLSGKYTAETRDPRKICNVLLGTFDTAEEEVQAYDTLDIEFRGVKVQINFLNLMDKMNRTSSNVGTVESLNMVAVVVIQPSPLPLPPPQPPP